MEKQRNKEELVKIDGLGRVHIPSEKRKKLQIKTGDKLEVYRSGRNIILKKTNIQTKRNTIQEMNIIIDQKTEVNIKINDLICDMEKHINSKHQIRVIDELGKIVIPIEERQELKIKENDEFKAYLKDDMIILIKKERKYNNGKRNYTYSNKRETNKHNKCKKL